jgi:hypothetical protein
MLDTGPGWTYSTPWSSIGWLARLSLTATTVYHEPGINQ